MSKYYVLEMRSDLSEADLMEQIEKNKIGMVQGIGTIDKFKVVGREKK